MILDPSHYPYEYREIVALCQISDDELARLGPSDRMAAGLMLRCADLLAAGETLVHRGHPAAVGVLLRSVLDSVVTAFWLLDNPEENFPRFLGEHLRNLKRRIIWSGGDEAWVEEHDFYLEQSRSWGITPEESDLPGMGTRAASLWSDLRPLYKELSTELHASVRSANLALLTRMTSRLQNYDPYIDAPQDWMAEAAYMTLALAKRLHDAHDWDGREDVDYLYEALRDWHPRARPSAATETQPDEL